MNGRERVHGAALAAGMAALALAASPAARGVLFDATGDVTYNTNAPSGPLAGSGWDYEGQFSNVLGTAIAPHYFLTSDHIVGTGNVAFVFAGSNYTVTGSWQDPANSDLHLCRVDGRLPRYAPVYTGTNEVGAAMMVFGRGSRRGDVVIRDGVTNGWVWGTSDGVMRWGSNTVASIQPYGGHDYLYATFDHGAGPDECDLSAGDSGGAAFILADGVWQLAGILYGVDDYYTATNAGDLVDAIDTFGLYAKDGSTWTLVTNHVASGFYASRVAACYAWLTNAIPDFDSNANGIPDGWEQQYSGSIHGLAATNDPDQDGRDNYAEWVALTDPTNAQSVFRVDAVEASNGVTSIAFQGWTNRLYTVYVHDPPVAATDGWTAATALPFAGVGGATVWTDTNAVAGPTSRYYRVGVSVPP